MTSQTKKVRQKSRKVNQTYEYNKKGGDWGDILKGGQEKGLGCECAPECDEKNEAIKRLRTRSAAVRHWRDFGLKRLRTRSCHE